MVKFLSFLASLSAGLALFIWVAKMVGWQEIKNVFLAFSVWQGLVILLITLAVALIGNWKWKEILKGEGVKVPFFSLLGPYLAGFAIMFLAPVLLWAGEIFRGYVIKERNQVPLPKAMASVIIDRILEWTANLAVIFFGLLFFLLTIGFPSRKIVLIFGGAFFVFALVTFFFYFKVFKRESVVEIFLKLFGPKAVSKSSSFLDIEKEIFNFFKLQNKTMWVSFILAFIRAEAMYLRTIVLIMFLGKSVSVLPALSILGFTFLAVMLPIPAALGSHELIQAFVFNSLRLGASSAAAFTLIIRSAELLISLAGLMILFKLGTGLLKNALLKRINGLAKNY